MSWNKAHAPLLVKSFPKTPRTQSEASQISGSHNYKTKQNKLPSSIDVPYMPFLLCLIPLNALFAI
jgi:hypothetical protein